MQLRNIIDRLWRRADAFAHPLERRQGNSGKVLTIVQVITSVQPKTFTGSAIMVTSTVGSSGGSVLVGGAVIGGGKTNSAAAASSTDSSDGSAASSTDGSAESTSSGAQSSQPSSAASVSSQVSQITSAPVAKASSNVVQGSAASQSASATPAASSGMSGGAKAGLAFGILFLIGALLAGVLMLYRRQKQKKEAHERLDDEKAAMSQPRNPDALPRNPEPVYPTAPVMAQATVPAARSQDTLNAPRLELRPVTQFDPRMSTMNNIGPAAAAGAVGGAAMAANNTPRTPSPSSWEKRGAQQHANDPTNPFGNHAETLNNSPPQTAQGTLPPPISAHKSIDAADFPLPVSGQVSPKPISLQYDGSTDSLPNPVVPYAPATVSNVSLPISEIAAAGVAGVVVAGAGAVVAGRGGNSPPLDNVHRVQLDFKPSMEDELEIRAGQLVRLLHEYDDGWALCTRMDRSQQGVVPRTCLSKQMVKPRPNPNGSPSGAPPSGPPQARPGQGPRGPGPNGSPQMRGPGPHMMQGNGRNSPAPYAQIPRPLTPNGRNSPAPYPGGRASPAPFAQAPRPQSPAGGPQGQRSRAMSNAPAYRAYQPSPQGPQGQQQRSQSPGPYGPPGMMRPPPIKDNNRRRSNSMSNLVPGSAPIVAGNAPIVAKAPSLARKPVPGQAV